MGSSVLPQPLHLEGPTIRQSSGSSTAHRSSMLLSSSPSSVHRSSMLLSSSSSFVDRSSMLLSSASHPRLGRTGQTRRQLRPRLPLNLALQSSGCSLDGKKRDDCNSELGPSCVSWNSEEGIQRGKATRQRESGNAASSSSSSFTLFSFAPMIIYPLIAESTGYSQASYYTSLGLFVISVPGIWSLVKRSTKSKIVKKTFAVPGPNLEAGKPPSQIAGEITSSLCRNNFAITERGDTVTFEGSMVPSRGQAAFLSFCTAISLGCVALVLSITVPDVGENWGFYYWTRASRKEQIKVKMVVADDELSTDVIVQGDDEQIDRLRRELGLMEKGMVYVKGILER